jgi:hypothetical protein
MVVIALEFHHCWVNWKMRVFYFGPETKAGMSYKNNTKNGGIDSNPSLIDWGSNPHTINVRQHPKHSGSGTTMLIH